MTTPRDDVAVGRARAAAVVVAVVAFAFGAIAMFGALAVMHAPVLDRADASPVRAGAMSIDDVLLEHVPPGIAPSCADGDLRPETMLVSAYASVVCHPGAPVTVVQYSSIHDAEAIRAIFQARLVQSGLTIGAGDCSTGPHGAAHWFGLAGGASDVRHSFTPTPGATRGSMVCYVDANGVPWIEWYDSDTHIYAFASAAPEDYAALFAWWQATAGPFHPRHAAMTEPSGSSPASTSPGADPSMSM